MKINKNSIGVKVYQYVWGEGLPNNLCSYFWKSILGYMLLPLVTLFQLFYYPLSLIPAIREDIEDDNFGKRVMGAALIVVVFLLFCIGVFISSAWITYQKETLMFEFYRAGGVIVCLSLIGGFALLMVFIFSSTKGKRDNLVKEYIKAKKGKYCPKIEWVENER